MSAKSLQRAATAVAFVEGAARLFITGVLVWWVLDAIKDRYGPWISHGFGIAVIVMTLIALLNSDDEVKP